MRRGLRIVLIASACWCGAQSVARAEKLAPPFVPDSVCHQAAAKAVSKLSRHLSNSSDASTEARQASHIAIIIDDLGYSLERGRLATQLPGAVTLAVLPHSPHGRRLAELAHREGKEVMMHAPMSNVSGRPLDEGGLTSAMDRSSFTAALRDNLQALPHVSGVNNHMGSQLTQEKRPMQWLMGELKSRQLYFVDSRTSPDSVAQQIAQDQGLPSLARNFFLDNEQDCRSIGRQFGLFLVHAQRKGRSVAIAHPYPETLRFLDAALPMLEPLAIRVVPVSHLLSPAPSPNPPLDGPADYIGRLR